MTSRPSCCCRSSSVIVCSVRCCRTVASAVRGRRFCLCLPRCSSLLIRVVRSRPRCRSRVRGIVRGCRAMTGTPGRSG